MRIDSSGCVGIGLTPTAYRLTTNVASGDNTFGQYVGGTLYGYLQTSSNNVKVGTNAATPVIFETNGTERARIDSSGNVGIGSTSPNIGSLTRALTINTPTGGNYSGVELAGAGTLSARFVTNNAAGTFFGSQLSIPLVFETNATERARIDSSGNVGIGTSSPSAKFQVDSSSATYSANIRARNSNFGSGVVGAASGILTVATDMNNIAFYTGSDLGVDGTSVPTNERMRIGSGGNVGIGRADASDVRLIVKGVDSGATNYAFSADNSSSFSLLYLRNDKYFNSGAIANYSVSGTALVIDGSNFVGKTTSSLRYKKDIFDYDKGLDAIAKLRPVYYKSAVEGPNGIDPKQHAGFIAEEIADEGFEEFLVRNNEGEPDAIQYAQMTALLCKAIQEQQALIQSLTARITALESN